MEIIFLHTFLRAQTIFLISGKKFVKIHMIFIQNKNHNDQIVFLQNLHLGLCKNDHFQKKRVRFEEQIHQNWILKIHILILNKE